jgi:DNA polymerase III alpha subunit
MSVINMAANCVSQIITFNRLSSKAVIRDVARVLKIPIPTVNKITKFIPSKFGKVYTIDQALRKFLNLKWVKNSDDPQIQDLIKYARILEGMNRNASNMQQVWLLLPMMLVTMFLLQLQFSRLTLLLSLI